jgi:hypothetical protein
MRLEYALALLLLLHAGAAAAKGPYSDVKEELAALKLPHAWAGVYHGPGAMSPTSLYLAPSGRYCVVTFWDAGGSETGYCGRLSLRGGVFRENLWSRMRNGDRYDGPPYIRISWGERRYLIPEKRILEFINHVNGTSEPRHGGGFLTGGAGFLLSGGLDILVTGAPEVPSQYRPFLLMKPLMTAAVEISSRTNIITRYDRFEDEDCGAEARFGAGASSGIFIGMALHAQTSDVQAEALVKEVWISSSAGRIKQDDCDKTDPLPPGTRFASRPAWRINVSLSTEPLSTEIRFASEKRFPPIFSGPPEDLLIDDPFPGAAAAGFSWEEVAEVTFRGPFLGALTLGEVIARRERTILSIGGNAFISPERNGEKEAEEAGGLETKRLRVLRLSHLGKPIDPGSNFSLHFAPRRRGENNRYDWKRAAVSARAASCGLPTARRNAVRAAALDILHWDEKMLNRAQDLRFEDLDPEQLRAVESFVPEGRRRGRVWPALSRKDSPYSSQVWKRGYDAEREFARANPGEAAECRKLDDEASRSN